MRPKFILLDIEGTTTAISFVTETLFPYFLKNYRGYISTHNSDREVLQQLEAVQNTFLEENDEAIDKERALEVLAEWVEQDRKHTALKYLQGLVWKKGFESGEIKSHIYPEVPEILNTWKRKGIQLGIYSSGSVAAQKMLFSYTKVGDLSSLFSAHFDTTTGHKREVNSYKSIANTLTLDPRDLLFLSDIEEELDAAQNAGLQTLQIVRPGTSPGTRHATALDFMEANDQLG